MHELGIVIIPLSVHFPDESFLETEIDQEYFYNKIQTTGIIPTSSQPSQGEIYEVFRQSLARGDDVLAVFISSAMSGTYSTALGARDRLSKEYPDRRIEILDSHTNCMALGLQAIAAAKIVRSGGNMEDAIKAAVDTREKVHFYFTPETLEYLRKGGRIGTASALLGSLLQITPILTVDMDKGMTHLVEKVRGSSRAVNRILELIKTDHEERGLRTLIVHHINAAGKAAQLKKTLFEMYSIPVDICSIGPVIGLHTGLGTIGVVYCTNR